MNNLESPKKSDDLKFMKANFKTFFVYAWLILIFSLLSLIIFYTFEKIICPGRIFVESISLAVCWVFLFIPIKGEVEKMVNKCSR